MAKLTTKARDDLPKKDFGEPGKKAYPMPNKAHAIDAKARASEEVEKGKLSSGEKAKIDAKADRVEGKTKSRGQAAHDKYRGDHAMPKGC